MIDESDLIPFPVVMISSSAGVSIRDAVVSSGRRGGKLFAQLARTHECTTKKSDENLIENKKEKTVDKESIIEKHKDRMNSIQMNSKKTKPDISMSQQNKKGAIAKKEAIDSNEELDTKLATYTRDEMDEMYRRAKYVSSDFVYRHQYPEAHDIASTTPTSGAVRGAESASKEDYELELKQRKNDDNTLRVT